MMKKWPLLFILMIGILTPVLSTALFFLSPPQQKNHHGEILEPIMISNTNWQHYSTEELFNIKKWRGYWVLLQASSGYCDQRCRQWLCQMRQLRLMLPGSYLRLRRVWLVTTNNPKEVILQSTDCGAISNQQLIEVAPLVNTVDKVDILLGSFDYLPVSAPPYQSRDYLYLIDPMGRLVMRFSPDLDIRQIHRDLSRLLKISKGQHFFNQGSG